MKRTAEQTNGFEGKPGRRATGFAMLVAAAVALSLGACGRKGSLEAPAPGYAPVQQQDGTATGSQLIDLTPEPAQTPEKKSFLLDFLI